MNKTKNAIPRNAYFVMETVRTPEGELIVCIAVENELGYYKTDWLWGKSMDEAEAIADKKNEAMGISRKDAAKIVLSSMFKKETK